MGKPVSMLMKKNTHEPYQSYIESDTTLSSWASEASPTLGCSIKISRDIVYVPHGCPTTTPLRNRVAGYVTGHPVVQPVR